MFAILVIYLCMVFRDSYVCLYVESGMQLKQLKESSERNVSTGCVTDKSTTLEIVKSFRSS